MINILLVYSVFLIIIIIILIILFFYSANSRMADRCAVHDV